MATKEEIEELIGRTVSFKIAKEEFDGLVKGLNLDSQDLVDIELSGRRGVPPFVAEFFIEEIKEIVPI